VRLTQGSPPVLALRAVLNAYKTEIAEGEPEAVIGTEGGRFTGSTNDSGPKKPGNSVEDKTLTIRERRI